ncbi:MAG: DMT family transporter [Dorea sp.]|jgi:drug/metabolite transporter (DMT)-like permease|nr:DMT family transporter [Dorea sp.]
MKKYLGILGLLTVTVIWGGGFVASDMALETLSPFQIMVIRFLIAAVLMTLLGVKQIRTISREEARCGIWLGSALFGGFALQIIALQYTTPSKNAFLTATNVVLVPFIALVIYRKKIEVRSLIGAGMALVGAGVLSLKDDFSIGLGDGLTLLCAVCFALQIFLTGEYVGRIRPAVLNFLQMTTACVLSAAGLLLSGDYTFAPSARSFLAVLYLGVVSTTITYLLQTVSQKYVDETKSAIILSMEAVFGTFFSVVLLHESVTVRMLAGSALILAAVLVSEISFKKTGKKEVIR